jgi:predicted secreted protein
MPATKQTGTGILFKIGTTVVGGQSDCNLTINGEEIELSSKDTAYWKEFLAGRADWTVGGSGIVMFDTTAHLLETSQKAIYTAITTGQTVAVEIALTGTLKFAGSGFFTNMSLAAPDNAAATMSWTVRGTTALVLTEGGGG